MACHIIYTNYSTTTQLASYSESSLPNETWIGGPPHNTIASAPATAIMSAQDTNKGKFKCVGLDQIST